jgi:hypothetical protein
VPNLADQNHPVVIDLSIDTYTLTGTPKQSNAQYQYQSYVKNADNKAPK